MLTGKRAGAANRAKQLLTFLTTPLIFIYLSPAAGGGGGDDEGFSSCVVLLPVALWWGVVEVVGHCHSSSKV